MIMHFLGRRVSKKEEIEEVFALFLCSPPAPFHPMEIEYEQA